MPQQCMQFVPVGTHTINNAVCQINMGGRDTTVDSVSQHGWPWLHTTLCPPAADIDTPTWVAMAAHHPLPSSCGRGRIPTWVAMSAIHIIIGHPQYTRFMPGALTQ
eukprot:scaffold55169_cov79-Attheya_sp.AAC.2